MKRIVIGISGAKGSGKTALARMLVKEYNFTRRPFATPIKRMLAEFLRYYEQISGVDIDEILNEKEKPSPYFLGQTPRHAMQTLGTEWGRRLIHPDIWVHAWREAAKNFTQNIVADDVRFPNEGKAIRSLGGKLIKIIRWDARPADDHPSEREYLGMDFDIVLANHEGTPKEMLKTVEKELKL